MRYIKRLIAGLLIFPLTPTLATATGYEGKLDLGHVNPEAIVLREFNDGAWLVGAQYQVWHLEASDRWDSGGWPLPDREVFHASFFAAKDFGGRNVAYGPSAGANVGDAARSALDQLEVLVPAVSNIGYVVPPFVSKLASWTSVDIYGGYRPVCDENRHHFIYGVGGKVSIPVDKLYAWAKAL